MDTMQAQSLAAQFAAMIADEARAILAAKLAEIDESAGARTMSSIAADDTGELAALA